METSLSHSILIGFIAQIDRLFVYRPDACTRFLWLEVVLPIAKSGATMFRKSI
ncbi:hypothetical protein HMPREF9695_02422 [Afipia broomeae ATCC 49717]|uniref:Uncharacterized protein n=1 Tax=Afipia broomeae ATCC 49717 TaxID=883078 RepID=K8P7L8_9BRAD|nr:hypothetical protein HMPREF9695_02422 [Afipia broomeae ATCC 49717]